MEKIDFEPNFSKWRSNSNNCFYNWISTIIVVRSSKKWSLIVQIWNVYLIISFKYIFKIWKPETQNRASNSMENIDSAPKISKWRSNSNNCFYNCFFTVIMVRSSKKLSLIVKILNVNLTTPFKFIFQIWKPEAVP